MKTRLRRLALGMALPAIAFSMAWGQTQLKPGFNIFSPEQDVEIGEKSAAEIERQLPVLQHRQVSQYIEAVGSRLARETEGPEFPYQFKVVDVADVNAFALPGGFMYVHRGLIEAAGNEAELAGVMAHELSHVALRHGTNQASKAYLAQAGLGIVGAILGGGAGGGSTAQIIGAVGGFGLNATFMKFSRDAEKQADLMGAQILARSGYDPIAMSTFFEQLRELQGREPGKFEIFFSDHPAPQDRAAYVADETRQLRVRLRPAEGNFDQIKSVLSRLPKARSMKELASGAEGQTAPSSEGQRGRSGLGIEPPSEQMTGFEPRERLYQIWYPSNWKAIEANQGPGVTFLPEGGVVQSGGRQNIVYGTIMGTFRATGEQRYSEPFRGRSQLERATNEFVNSLIQGNAYLRPVRNSTRRETIDGLSGLSVMLSGRSDSSSSTELVTLYTVQLSSGDLLYTLFITPEQDRPELEPTFSRMLSSLRIVARTQSR